VLGLGGVTLLHEGKEERFQQGHTFSLGKLGPFRQVDARAGMPDDIWESVQLARSRATARGAPEPSAKVRSLVEERDGARSARDWAAADALRERIADLGWQVLDTPEGPRLEPK
jgi:cysteinyl-tRNA synthetase